MGIDIGCIEQHYSCGYGYWNLLRTEVIRATNEYLKVHISLNPAEEDTNDKIHQKEILEFLDTILNTNASYSNNVFGVPIQTKATPVDVLINICDLQKLDLLIYFGIGGLFAFCNKSDCEGYYSVGNSYDICELFSLIKPFVIKNNEYDYLGSLIQVEKIFIESVRENHIVVIS